MNHHCDVVIIGAGLAGSSLARQLLLYTGKTIVQLDREPKLPINRQKVGESNVQVAGHYFAKVLDVEDYLFHEHVMKYNLRFMWKTAGRTGTNFEDFSHSYIRQFSNIACYQLDRNKFEGELIRRNQEYDRYRLLEGVKELDVSLGKEGVPHSVRCDRLGESHQITCTWLVDTSGRMRRLASQLDSRRESEIQHSASFFWVEGTVNIEKLTDASLGEIRKRPERRHLGHAPIWLATNHFMGEGFWFWVIPLHSRTSFGLVYDNHCIDPRDVSTKDKLFQWLFREFPLFERELVGREIIDFSVLRNYSHDCVRTIHADRWAMSGFAGRFTDPLYSPGGDTIAIHNTLITDAILTDDDQELAAKAQAYEMMMKTVYLSFVPSFHHSYKALGDQEAFSMKYVWELSVYFAFYVFPFINDLYCDRYFLVPYLRRFSKLGDLNRALLAFITDYYEWKKANVPKPTRPVFFDFTNIATLRKAESTFYQVGVDPKMALEELDHQLESLRELARFFVAHVSAIVAGDSDLVTSRAYVEAIDLAEIRFCPEEIRQRWSAVPRTSGDDFPWSIDARVLRRWFHSEIPL
jgi:flavin-dependent dehydrogenase